MSYIIYAIPFFFLLIALELLAEHFRKTDYYRTNDAINSLTAGVLSRMFGILKALAPFTIYVMLYDNYALFTSGDSIWLGLIAFVLYDFCYYWNHRFGHEMSILWAAHVVHHSSEEYNLTTALRQTSGSFLSWIFYLPLAFLGVDPLLLLTVGSLNLIYQFWVHTRHIGRLGWLEWIFVTPSNHRAHHAQNQIYIDRNYGGVFIIWDRLFGSFQDELDQEPPIYGIRKALHSWNPIYANTHVYQQLIKDSWRTKAWSDKFKVWFGKTGWRPADMERDYPLGRVDLTRFKKFDIVISTRRKVYALIQHGLTTFVGLVFLLNITHLALMQQLLIIAWVIFASVSVGEVLAMKVAVWWLEVAKYLALVSVLVTQPIPFWLMLSISSFTVVSVAMWPSLKKEYTNIVEQKEDMAIVG
ncbi:alkylglycerol monooxygenase [Paraglaciecola mesophila KMM 241]|uniref:Alkylglycerol monooxygenase n=1 Tax=Paraglaciecola mesophila KMM 241 TaxID=1128912 RepID=K6YS90_9ALTE|nr:sterol desaturase family protein [Paraglaciecola mesophila]GAC26796.1 alkylglycerol monooxygenase [Paraglaciecola mesophila KMM 241]